MNAIKVLKTQRDYQKALIHLEKVFDALPGTKQGCEAELLMVLIQDYENRNYKIEAPDAIAAINFRMEQGNLKQVDLIPFIGSASRVSEILNRKRDLTINMILALNEGLGIPLESLMRNDTTPKFGTKVIYPETATQRISLSKEKKSGYMAKKKGSEK